MLGSLSQLTITYLDIVPIRQFVDDRLPWVFTKLFETSFEISGNVADLLLSVTGIQSSSFLSTVGEINAVLFH